MMEKNKSKLRLGRRRIKVLKLLQQKRVFYIQVLKFFLLIISEFLIKHLVSFIKFKFNFF